MNPCSVAALLVVFAAALHAQTTVPTDIAQQCYQWLVQQQSANDTGILGNQESDDFAGLYPNALAAMCFMHQGEIGRAERIFQFYQKHFDREFGPETPGGFPQFANAKTGQLDRNADRWIGDNGWLLIALNDYHRRTGNRQFDPMRQGIARWLIGLQDSGGGIKAGFNKDGPMLHFSTEGNLDCYVALVDYPQNRKQVLGWLTSQMWVPSEKRFKMGSTVDESALDTCSWAIAALGKDYASTLAYTESKFARTDKCDGSGVEISAFADLVDKSHIWLEGSGEMAVAYNVAGRREDANRLLAEMEKAMVPSQRFRGLRGLPCATSDPAWKGGSTLIFVPSQAWYLFAKWDFNPMAVAEKDSP